MYALKIYAPYPIVLARDAEGQEFRQDDKIYRNCMQLRLISRYYG